MKLTNDIATTFRRLLTEPTPEMRRRAEEYDAKYSPEEQERILDELRSLRLDPPLSEVIIRARDPLDSLDFGPAGT